MSALTPRGLASPPPAASPLENLPGELLHLIASYLCTEHLRAVALASRTLHGHASDLLWQHVSLADSRTHHQYDGTEDLLWDPHGQGKSDEHDDTHIIYKLHILAKNPMLAAKVQTLTHRCHLPTPNIFNELPYMFFDGDNLSKDERLHKLLRATIRNLVNVHTLRIVYGHWHLTTALVSGFLDHERPRAVALRKLWLESCTFNIRDFAFLGPVGHSELESVRLRRLRAEPRLAAHMHGNGSPAMKLTRGANLYQMQNGAGAWLATTVDWSPKDPAAQLTHPSRQAMMATARLFDDMMWNKMPDIEHYVEHLPDNTTSRAPSVPMAPMHWLFQSAQSTLTRLNLDWILWYQRENVDEYNTSSGFFKDLAALRFPHLVAFQVRNAVLPLTKLPNDVFLLEDTFLEFLENHLKIKCLAWPLDRIYNNTRSSVELQARCRILIAHLAMVLTDLRLDTYYAGKGEPVTDDGITAECAQQRFRRRRFIVEFAPHMRKIKRLKLEGGIPRDEKRELLRALHYCPLEKVVLIGVSFPVGNTWGAGGARLKALDAGPASDFALDLEGEDIDGIITAYKERPSLPGSLPADFTFEPRFGWSNELPLLHTLALHHSDTIQEIKICGYNGCPVLSHLTPETTPLLAPLVMFPNLRQIVVSFWLLTYFENAYRDMQIVQSWKDTRSSSSTALVVVPPPRSPELEHPVDGAMMPEPEPTAPRPEFNRWAVALKTKFTPSALAYRVAHDLGQYLCPAAKAREGGVRIRASFCLGAREARRAANDIFDLDMRIGRDDQVLEFVGPREEGENGRWWAKMEGRKWF